MRRYRYNGLDIVEDNNSIHLKNVRDGKVIFYTDNGNTCYNYDVKFLNRFDKIYHNDPRSDFIEMVAYSLITHGVK